MSINDIDEYEINMLQLSDSFFPTGMYSTSSGLETFFYQKKIRNVTELQQLLKVYIENQIGPADCVALGNSIDCMLVPNLQMLIKIDEKLLSMKLIKEIREVSVRSGTQLLKCISAILPENKILQDYQNAISQGEASGLYPVALGLTCALFNIPKKRAGLVLIYSFAVSLIGAALRLGMIIHFEGQKIINELKPIILNTVKKNVDRQLLDMWQFTPEIDLTQILHEQSERRMFIS